MDAASFYRAADARLCQGDILERVPHIFLKDQPRPLRPTTLTGKNRAIKSTTCLPENCPRRTASGYAIQIKGFHELPSVPELNRRISKEAIVAAHREDRSSLARLRRFVCEPGGRVLLAAQAGRRKGPVGAAGTREARLAPVGRGRGARDRCQGERLFRRALRFGGETKAKLNEIVQSRRNRLPTYCFLPPFFLVHLPDFALSRLPAANPIATICINLRSAAASRAIPNAPPPTSGIWCTCSAPRRAATVFGSRVMEDFPR
jgi:hypothetical protein